MNRTHSKLILGTATAWLFAHWWRSLRRYSFHGRTVLITGGSRGLGLELSRQLGRQGAKIMLVARDAGELERAADDLRERGVAVQIFPGDVREPATAPAAVAATVAAYGRLDVLINNAGIILVAPLENVSEADFENAMATHFWAPLRFMQAALPELKRTRGRIVNISSIGGKIAVPHLTAYSASKFALAGLSDGFRAELAKDGVAVTSVFPGLLRTGSHIQAVFKGQPAREFAWFALGAATPLTSTSAPSAAQQIIRACQDGAPELVITFQAKLAVLVNALLPNAAGWFAKLATALLPAAGPANHAEPGWKVRGPLPPPAATVMADQASAENNELA